MTDKINAQIGIIRKTGKINMFDAPLVRETAMRMGFRELASFIGRRQTDYTRLILCGKRGTEGRHGR